MPELLDLPEPSLLFGYEQVVEDPRDGLTLFGPLDAGKPYGIRAGAIGTPDGLRRFENWVQKIQGLVAEPEASVARPPFPGFETALGIPWSPTPTLRIVVPEDKLRQTLYLDDRHLRVYQTVEVFSRRIIEALRNEDTAVDVGLALATQPAGWLYTREASLEWGRGCASVFCAACTLLLPSPPVGRGSIPFGMRLTHGA
jgi:hypothetical protein